MTKVVHVGKDKFDIYIGRPSKWGNPYMVGRDGTREEVIKKYHQYLLLNLSLLSSLSELRGKVLGCHCKPLVCHGDVLVELVERGSPAKTIVEYLEMTLKINPLKESKKFPYLNIEHFVLANGKAFAKKSQKPIKKGKMRECYKNAFYYAENEGLIYIEGFANTEKIGLPFLHGWCADEKGTIYDPTWSDGVEYFGVPFDMNYVRKVILKRKIYGVLDNLEMEFPLIRGVHKDFEYRGLLCSGVS